MPQQQEKHIAATWSETGKVHIFDLSPYVTSLNVPGTSLPKSSKPAATVNSHGRVEGYALDWSSLDAGR